MRPCQGRDRGFESRRPRHSKERSAQRCALRSFLLQVLLEHFPHLWCYAMPATTWRNMPMTLLDLLLPATFLIGGLISGALADRLLSGWLARVVRAGQPNAAAFAATL